MMVEPPQNVSFYGYLLYVGGLKHVIFFNSMKSILMKKIQAVDFFGYLLYGWDLKREIFLTQWKFLFYCQN